MELLDNPAGRGGQVLHVDSEARSRRPAAADAADEPQQERAHERRHPGRRRRSRHPRTRRRHPGGRGPSHPHGRRPPTRRSPPIEARRPHLVFLDIWLQGSRLDGLQVLDLVKGAAPRPAGGDDLRPRQHRDRRLGDQVGRLRLHREAVQGRPPRARRRAGARSLAAEARGARPEGPLGAGEPHRRPLGRRQPAAPDDRARRADQRAHPRHRRAGLRQGARGAHPARPLEPAPTGPSSCSPPRRSRPRTWRPSCSASRARTAGAAASARSRRRMAARSTSTRSPTCRARRRTASCASSSTRTSSASAARRGSTSTCASSPRRAATSPAEIAAGRFREDLFHRLSVVPIRVPSLAERREDVPELIEFFMDQISAATGLPRRRIAEDAMAVLQSHDWPGNVRQLRNNVERLMILTTRRPGCRGHGRDAAVRDRRRWCRRRPAGQGARS